MSEARAAYDADAIGSFGEFASPHIEYGTAGHADADTVEDLGDGSDGPNGRTLIRVTLFKGRDATKRPQKGIAQGHKILCQVMAPLYAVPPKNALVLVAFPASDVETPGAGVIWGWIDNSPSQQFKASRAVLDVGAGMDLVIKGRTVTLMDHTGDAPGSFGPWIGIGPIAGSPTGVYVNDGNGAGLQVSGGVFGAMGTNAAASPVAKSILQLTASNATMSFAGGGYVTIAAGKTEVFHATNANVIAATVGLGTAPNKPVLGGLTGAAAVPALGVLVGT